MTDQRSALEKVRRARFETQISELMQQRKPREHQLMLAFASQSDAFAELQGKVIDHYFFEQRQLSPLFCVDAVARLVDEVVATVQVGQQQAA